MKILNQVKLKKYCSMICQFKKNKVFMILKDKIKLINLMKINKLYAKECKHLKSNSENKKYYNEN